MQSPIDQLSRSSSQFARSALQALPTGGWMVFALHAGAALEHLSKALLASKHPALISAEDYESLLHATGHDAQATRPVMRTIGFTESVKRCSRFVPQLANLEPELRLLYDARNGVAHLAQ